ncbi:MAG: winged helix-turn-helix domain-containing protein, partial [Anaerolineae bacterium]|nr:winged helix-turn-helix domain-containing protein [Anaerolineae bacterium]
SDSSKSFVNAALAETRADQNWLNFPAYLDHLGSADAVALRNRILDAYLELSPQGDAIPENVGSREDMMRDVDTYLDFLRTKFCDDLYDEALEAEAYEYLLDPKSMQRLIVSHLSLMWIRYLQPEWQRVRSMLRDAINAFSQIDYSQMSRLEVARFITGHDLSGSYWEHKLESAETVTFVPSAHVGPYLGKFHSGKDVGIIFGARLPEGSLIDAPDLSRADVVVRLNALADDTRLQIVQLIQELGEMSSQDVMNQLNLSQSAASRHLKQLSATGYLSERRCNGAKCYDLNPDRIEETLQAIGAFLLGSRIG